MSKHDAPAPDFKGAAEATAQANRPDQQNAFGSTTQWDGNRMVQSFGGPFAGLSGNLQQQAADAMGQPLDFSGMPQLDYGADARTHAEDAAYQSATSRLDPQFAQREDALRTQLLNQGLDPGSEAARNAMGDFERARTDAYGQARHAAVGQGMAAQQQAFQQSAMARQQAIAEALRKRGMPMAEMQGLAGFLAQPGFQPGANYLQAAGLQGQYDMARRQGDQQYWADIAGGVLDFGGDLAGSIVKSDERAKQDVRRLPVEVLPGVPLATWEYLPQHGPPGRHVGVIAQDLEKVAPEYVLTGPDGMRLVDYSFLQGVSRG